MSDQPKPSGEWTRQSVVELLHDVNPGNHHQVIADAHNAALAAALAAERQNHTVDLEHIFNLETQLAAQQEKFEAFKSIYEETARQLTAEREKVELAVQAAQIANKQLAALQTKWDKIADEPMIQALRRSDEKVRTLVDSLKKYMLAMDAIYNHNEASRAAVEIHFGTLHPQSAFDALAKVGK